jgi:hypothetical protein
LTISYPRILSKVSQNILGHDMDLVHFTPLLNWYYSNDIVFRCHGSWFLFSKSKFFFVSKFWNSLTLILLYLWYWANIFHENLLIIFFFNVMNFMS